MVIVLNGFFFSFQKSMDKLQCKYISSPFLKDWFYYAKELLSLLE